MIRLYTPNQPLADDQFLITVSSFFRTHQWTFVVSSADTIREITLALRDKVDASIHEMSLFPISDDGIAYPYPLRDDMCLDRLQEEHRTLVLLIHENPEKAIPRRLLMASDSPQRRSILDLTEATEQDIPYIGHWITLYVSKVYLPWSHPLFPEMMNRITESLDGVDIPHSFAYYYYLVGPPQERITLPQRNAMLRFYRVVGDRFFRRVEVYAAKGICGNTEEEPMKLTQENMQGIDLLVADAIGQRVQ